MSDKYIPYSDRRWISDPGAVSLMCNTCVHNHFDLTCDAFPKRIPSALLDRREHGTPYEGDNGIRYEPIEKNNP